jgi:hypothetical protein
VGRFALALRLVAAALLVLLAAAGAPGAAGAAPDAAGTRYECGAKEWTFLFWPKGHPAIPAVSFPEFRVPHFEVYRGSDPTYPGSNFLGYVGADNASEVAPSCKKLKDLKALATAPMANPLRSKAAIGCTFPKPAWVQVEKVAGGGVRFQVKVILPPNKIVLYAQIAPQGSNAHYARQYCQKKAAPG